MNKTYQMLNSASDFSIQMHFRRHFLTPKEAV
jgi:hypothetical protein